MKEKVELLKSKAKKIRKDALDIAIEHKDGHIAPAFSVVEIMVALYDDAAKEEDKILLSKGHACITLYACLRDKGFNPTISGHPDIEEEHGVWATTGSLGHGLPIAAGMALARKIKQKEGHFFVVMGDGECQEGSVWEAMNLARKLKLDNLTVIVDHNKYQALDSVKTIMDEDNLAAKFRAFGANVMEIDGHDFEQLTLSFSRQTIKKGMARVVIAHTVKGRGCSFMIDEPCWHARLPEGDLLKKAYEELGCGTRSEKQ